MSLSHFRMLKIRDDPRKILLKTFCAATKGKLKYDEKAVSFQLPHQRPTFPKVSFGKNLVGHKTGFQQRTAFSTSCFQNAHDSQKSDDETRRQEHSEGQERKSSYGIVGGTAATLVMGSLVTIAFTNIMGENKRVARALEPNPQEKRKDYLKWDDYFMAIAFLSAQRSKDPSTQVGACIVNESKRIVGTGYNGMPDRCHDDLMSWDKPTDDQSKEKESSDETKKSNIKSKHLYVCHAEMNAIVNKNSADVKGCTIYVSLFPCNECAKIIIQSGIKKVVYYSDKHHEKVSTKASKIMLKTAGVECESYIPDEKLRTIRLNFEDINPQKKESEAFPTPTVE